MSEKIPEPYGWVHDWYPDDLRFRREPLDGIIAQQCSSIPVYSHEQMNAVLGRLEDAVLARAASQAQAEKYLAERDDARRKSVEWQRLYEARCERLYTALAERDRASSLFANIAPKHARLAAWAREALPEELQAQFFSVLASGSPNWKTAPRNLAVDLLAATAERDAARADLAQALQVLRDMEWDSWGYDRFGEGRAHCPCCGCTKDEGHASDCKLHAALAEKGE